MKYKVTFKEIGRSECVRYHSDNVSESKIIDTYGLNEPDIEYYKIEKVEESHEDRWYSISGRTSWMA